MKTVAFALLTLLVAAVPTHAEPLPGGWDECDDEIYLTPDKTSCKRIEIAEAGAPPQVTETTGNRLFLWGGVPDDESRSSVTGSSSVLGTLYGDSNGIRGLQRESFLYHGPRAPDHSLLI